MTSASRRRSSGAVALLLSAILLPGLAQLPALASAPRTGAPAAPAADDLKPGSIGDTVAGFPDIDTRGRALPTAVQRRAVARLGVLDARWNQFGTPSSLLPTDGVLGKATSANPVISARTWLRRNAAAFGLTATQVNRLDVVNSTPLIYSKARPVLFRQRFGSLVPALDSMVTVGVAASGDIAYASSSITPTDATPPAAQLSPLEGWLKAASSVGRDVSAADLAKISPQVKDGWTRLRVPGFAQEQQVRLRALAMANGEVRPVLEANVVDVQGGSASAYTVLVDAVDGSILYRENKVKNSSDVNSFQGSITASSCGPQHPFTLTDNKTKTITAAATALNPVNDIVVKLLDPDKQVLTSGDTGTSPETAVYTANSIPQGTYYVQVCPYETPTVPIVPPGNYVGSVITSDQGAPGTGASRTNPRWRFFPGTPTLDSPSQIARGSAIGCWLRGRGCTLSTGQLRNVQAFGPWDYLVNTQTPSFTTTGNNAQTREAWVSPLSPGGTNQMPFSAQQRYTPPFRDKWNNSRCNPAQLRIGGNDILASVASLFAVHNRMHDYSYYLGFTEPQYNMQLENLGRGGVDGDPEVGNAQAGALTGGQPSYLGRDNANQITLQDGIPGITNQYLFQPIAGAFYAPCTDGGLDMGIVGHEYTHAISNRMVGGPDQGLTSTQGGSMGESWGDLVGAEYMFSHNYPNGSGNRFAVGVYATGNTRSAIRNFGMNRSPLNFSDVGYDITGQQVHADGEIWSGTNWSVRQALVKKWNKKYPYRDKSLQLKCAQASHTKGVRRPELCPGNRRWIQLVFDAWLLQQGATSMLDARDAMIAADQMRWNGRNKKALWDAFAFRGMGKGAFTPNADSENVKASFVSPTSKATRVRFKPRSTGQVFVGNYEARVTPVADTIRKTKLKSVARFSPGRYRMLFVSPKNGFTRFTMRVTSGKSMLVRIADRKNFAAGAAGAKVIASSGADSLNPGALLDGTEATNWGGISSALGSNSGASVDSVNPSVSVDLAGGRHVVRRVQVSAYLTPAPPSPTDVPLAQPDPDSGSRFTALRRFAVDACVRNCDSGNAKWKRVYVSPKDAFPSLRPRPVSPTLILRSFKIRPTRASALRLVALENQCSGYAGYAGEQDADPTNNTDCKSASDRDQIVHAAEFQAFAR